MVHSDGNVWLAYFSQGATDRQKLNSLLATMAPRREGKEL